MDARARVVFPAALVSLVGVFFVSFARGKMPDPQYGLVVASLMMLVSVLFAAGDLKNFVIGRRWLFENGWFRLLVPKDDQFSYLAMPFFGSLVAFFMIAPVRRVAILLPMVPYAIGVFWVLPYTRTLLTTLSASRYLDSLVTIPKEGGTVKDEEMGMFVQNYGKKTWLKLFLVNLLLVVFAYNFSKIMGGSIVNSATLLFLIALVIAYFCWGEAANKVLVQYGLRREKGLLEGAPQDDVFFEIQRTFARRMKNVSIALAVVIYPATFVILYAALIH